MFGNYSEQPGAPHLALFEMWVRMTTC